mmetsp:Transcript_25565/g.49563  ORF Transcript_25565/g.49563 Transcript_25565/m.49563 type:complete len:186 (+) Transcript_25565:180-737(+)
MWSLRCGLYWAVLFCNVLKDVSALSGSYRLRLRRPLGIAFEECVSGEPNGVQVAQLVDGGSAVLDGRVCVGDKLLRCSAVVLGGQAALLSVGGQQYTSWKRELIECTNIGFDEIMAAIESNSGRFGYTDVVLELQHTAASVPRPPLSPSERQRLDDESGANVDWDWAGTKSNGVQTPIRPRPDDF